MPQILSALVHRTKASGYYRLDPAAVEEPQPPTRFIQLDEDVSDLRKAEGIPAVDKGREFGLEYIRPSESEVSEEPTESDAAVHTSN